MRAGGWKTTESSELNSSISEMQRKLGGGKGQTGRGREPDTGGAWRLLRKRVVEKPFEVIGGFLGISKCSTSSVLPGSRFQRFRSYLPEFNNEGDGWEYPESGEGEKKQMEEKSPKRQGVRAVKRTQKWSWDHKPLGIFRNHGKDLDLPEDVG